VPRLIALWFGVDALLEALNASKLYERHWLRTKRMSVAHAGLASAGCTAQRNRMQPPGMPRAHLGVAVVGEPQAARADVADGRAAEHAHDLGGAPAIVGHRQHVRHARRQRPQVTCARAVH